MEDKQLTDRIERYEAYLARGWRGKFTEATWIGLKNLVGERKRRMSDGLDSKNL